MKLSLDRPLGLQEPETPWISRQSVHVAGQVVSPMHRPPITPEDNPGTHFD